MLSDVVKDIEQRMISNYSKGLSDGESRGEAKGKAEALIRLIERRFAPLSADQRAMIIVSSLATLEAWFDRAIDAPNLDAVFAEPTIN